MGSLAVYFSCDIVDVLDASAQAGVEPRSTGMSTETEYLCHLLSCGVDRLLHGRVNARDDDEDDSDDEDFVRRLHPSLRFEGSVEHSRLMRRWLEVLGVPVPVFEPVVLGGSLHRTDLVAGIPGEQLARMHVPPLGFWNRDVVDILPVIDDVANRYLACDREAFEAFPLPRFLDQRSFDELMLRNLSVLRRLLEGQRHAEGRVMIVSEML